MARVKVAITGVTSQSNHQDGECKNITNLRPERGYYKPVTPRKIVQAITDDYDIVFVHKGNDYENWIGVINSTTSSSIYTNIKTSPSAIGGAIYERINSVQQIGNTLSFVTDNTIYYALYKNNNYVFLGEIPEIPNLSIGAYNETTVSRTYEEEYGSSIDWAEIVNLTKGLVYKATDIIVNGGVVGGVPVDGVGIMLFDAHLLRYAFRLYDGTLIKHSSPLLVLPASSILDIKKIKFGTYGPLQLLTSSYIKVTGYNIGIQIDTSGIEPWKDIITSVDIFLSPPLGLSNIEKLTEDRLLKEFKTASDAGGSGPESRIFESLDKEGLKSVSIESKFYFIKSLRIGEWSNPLTPYIIPTTQTDITKLENLIYQELMIDDQFSHHSYGANSSFIYNNRLRLSQIRTTFFKGFNTQHFDWLTNYNGTAAPSTSSDPTIIEVELLVDNKTQYVYAPYMDYFGSAPEPFLQSYLSYPDPRAKKMRIYKSASGVWGEVFSASLEPHAYLNISFFVNDNLAPIKQTGTNTRTPVTVMLPVTLFEKNKLKLSEINNPFILPSINTYLVGTGDILAESSIIMNVSDRNYGMYPVFVFTTDGVFTMAGQDAETVHSSVQAPTYLEPPISSVIGATPYGVVFITKRGLMQISNYKTEFLSQLLREDDDTLDIDSTGITGSELSYPIASFNVFLKTATSMVYNPYQDELIISASGYPYNYVYDYETKSFYLSTNMVGLIVQNSFPNIYYITDNNLIDISQSQGKASKVTLLTRPIQFQSADIKKLERIFLRALMYNASNINVAAYHSMDGVTFDPIRGFVFGTGGNYKDFDLGLMARETYRQYLFLLTGTIDEESQIEYIEFEVDKNYNNEKMR